MATPTCSTKAFTGLKCWFFLRNACCETNGSQDVQQHPCTTLSNAWKIRTVQAYPLHITNVSQPCVVHVTDTTQGVARFQSGGSRPVIRHE
jgi:hypothetical protein